MLFWFQLYVPFTEIFGKKFAMAAPFRASVSSTFSSAIFSRLLDSAARRRHSSKLKACCACARGIAQSRTAIQRVTFTFFIFPLSSLIQAAKVGMFRWVMMKNRSEAEKMRSEAGGLWNLIAVGPWRGTVYTCFPDAKKKRGIDKIPAFFCKCALATGYFRFVSNQSMKLRCQRRLFCGFSTQWVSSGK